ncbi:hypothetical protein KRE40_14115 [Elizabethkingia meningoseptica]|uniref:hypothetical protein n=1 Tax=Elizabethkingia meningoseptica TaxID=238 RepID=UPI0023B1BCA7|nr:hypothetical protein [Elizabethkingia meningoseptica]MDE5437093.1 hypothetical protein [Elizabethkingia meningoseptica]MDE5509776.1 hypothetical protein [Elizabethkingia meningoseptica]MDE5514397.1 hypothetical protein [Elizabethkingia meningoseptica]MDE5525044.1 hypothetical protein [Elizabethkingia meningoseptica]MDE5528608.1 hypothetical protein [Elizabethkingia meningoseptica]
MKNKLFIMAVMLSMGAVPAIQAKSNSVSSTNVSVQVTGDFGGKYSSEGEKNGIIAFDLSQTGAKVEGKARYQTFGKKAKKVDLSVKGNIKGGIAYIQFKDQKGSVIASGTLKLDGEDTVLFKQMTASRIIPREAVLLR